MTNRVKDLTGQKFGKLTVIQFEGLNSRKQARWLCKCECGGMKIVVGRNLIDGHTRSCGCMVSDSIRKANTKHGLSYTDVYKEWKRVKDRCYLQCMPNYKRYGGRGISMCDRWRYDAKTFYEDVSVLPNFGEPGYSLDRIDTNGNYEPGNVRWADSVTQANNRSNNVFVTYNGETKTLAQWSRELGIPYHVLRRGVQKGRTVDEILERYTN